VAVELKRAHDRGAVEQMIGYLKALQQQFPARTVRGIIIAGKADETACEMLRAVTEFQIELVVYEVRFSSVTASFPRVSEN
jgi:RecB family endonuclease NucS